MSIEGQARILPTSQAAANWPGRRPKTASRKLRERVKLGLSVAPPLRGKRYDFNFEI
jgi:hypothetical protein